MNHSVERMARRMRWIKFGASAALATLFVLALGSRAFAPLWAQVAATNPLIAPVPAPSAPAQLPAPVSTAIAPVLIAVPGLPTPSPTPVQRAFNCSCFGRGTGTHWMGQVAALSYFRARQEAIGACLTYNVNREPASPFINSGVAGGSNVPPLAGAAVTGLAAEQGLLLPGTINYYSAGQLELCSDCTCD